MDTLFSKTVAHFRRVVKQSKKIILGIILLSFVAGSAPLQVQFAHAQAAGEKPVGYDTANAIDKGIDSTIDKYKGTFADTVNGVLESVGRFLANILLLMARLLLKLASFLIDFILVIAGYNAYIDSTAVNIGWTVIRDITNMFFIIILLVIAFATILGLEGYEWKQMLPKLVTAAILVNFSRTICGLLIDASQVIMITFLNAVSATIGGNIINAFRLPTFEAFHPNIRSEQLTSSGIISAAALAMAFSAVVTAVLGAYVFILLGRLIRLWVLIVLSPLAFVMSVLPATSSMSSSWWSEMMDNLVTGPVIMFFIWLSLVVVGSGQANLELMNGSKLADKSPIEQAFGPEEQMATPTDIGGWNNLANFVIAIGMLFAGAKVASHIGGSSGNLLAAGMDFGKKVALAGIGYGLIRRFGSGAFGASKSLAGKAAGGAFNFIAGNTLGRAKKIVGAKVSGYLSDVERSRNQFASKLEKQREELDKAGQLGGVVGIGKSLGMRAISWAASSPGRLNKNVKNWEAIAEEKKKQVEETYGVSGLKAGVIKARESEFTKKYEAESAASKRRKGAEVQKSFSDGIGYIDSQLSPLQANLDAAKKGTNKSAIDAAEKALSSAKEKLMDKDHPDSVFKKFAGNKMVDPKNLMDYYNLNSKQIKSEAEAQELEHISHNAMKMAVAKERDELLAKEGKPPVFVNEAREQQIKERRDLLGKMNHDTAVEQVKDLAGKIRDNRAKLVTNPGDHHLQQMIKEQIDSMADLAALHATRGPGAASEAMAEAVRGFSPIEVDASDVVGTQAQVFSALLQREVAADETAVKEAFEELRKNKGEEFDAFMSTFNDSLLALASKGAVNMAGIVRGEWNDSQKKMVYRPTKMSTDGSWVDGKRNYAANQSRASLSTMQDFDDSLDQKRDPATGRFVPMIDSAASQERVIKVLANRTKEQISSIHRDLEDSLRKRFAELKARKPGVHAALLTKILDESSTENQIAMDSFVRKLM